jgi:hypothetical protein
MPPTLAELEQELAAFEQETEERRRFRTELKDLREELSDSGLRERLGPFLVRVEKFASEFIREPDDAERAQSLFSPWVAQLVGLRAEPLWRIPGGFAVLQRWCVARYALAVLARSPSVAPGKSPGLTHDLPGREGHRGCDVTVEHRKQAPHPCSVSTEPQCLQRDRGLGPPLLEALPLADDTEDRATA